MRWAKIGAVGVAALLTAGAVGFFGYLPARVDRDMNPVAPHDPYDVSAKAAELHERLVIGDWHSDSLLWRRSFLKHNVRGQMDLPRLQEGNVAVQVLTAVTKSPAGQNYDENSAEAFDNITLLAAGQMWPVRSWGSLLERALYQAERLHAYAAQSDGALVVVRSEAELEAVLAARASGDKVIAGILGIEGAHPLEGDLGNLEVLTDAGYRVIGLQHFFDNALGGSLHGQGNHGLTEFGRQVVEAVAARGLVLDLAHSSPQVVEDVLDMTDIPLVLSHTGLHSVCGVKRNIPDHLMKRIAQSGGVIGIGFWADVTCDDSPEGVARVILSAVEVLGEDHVSLGSDFDGTIATRFDSSELAVLTQALLDQGASEQVIAKVMGENMIRVLRARLN